MTNPMNRFLAALLLGGAMLAAPAVSHAEKGMCGQPSSTGTGPKTSDCLTILKEAVGQTTDCDTYTPPKCVCDVNNNGTITSPDALLCLQKAVGQDKTLTCPPCDDGKLPCTSAEITTRPGSDLDSGWTGLAHDSDVVLGASISARVKRECAGNQDIECQHDADCGGDGPCVATCDCNGDTSCEVTGPTHGKSCLTTLADCDTNADCPVGVACVSVFGPPLPLSSGGTPVCVVTLFDSPLTGTADSATGEARVATTLKSRVFLGIALDKPCPRCGSPAQLPEVGDMFTCSGGPNDAAACVVEGVSADFGGTSRDCPPDLGANISGSGLAIRFTETTTGTSTKTAGLPCGNFAFRANPLNAGSNPKCLDNNAACSSNADCKRCALDNFTTCTSNADCSGGADFCAEAPDQPVTCGFWCNCGFCDNNPSLPCFETADCAQGQTCVSGTGTGTQPNSPQQKPNDCGGDKFICGQFEKERCALSTKGTCSLQPYRTCSSIGDPVCPSNNAGVCVIESRPCFESRITRTGTPSPLGDYCSYESKTCTSNADCTKRLCEGGLKAYELCSTNGDCGTGTCTGEQDTCVQDASRAQTVALFCVPATSASSVNTAGGITGPGAVRLNSLLKVCRCGDGIIGCDEQCDDSNTMNGDGCDDLCQIE